MLILHEKSGLIIFLSEKQLFLITSPESHVWTGPSLKGSHRQMDLECRGFRPPKRLPRSLVQTYLTFKKETFWWICNWDVAINPPHKSVFLTCILKNKSSLIFSLLLTYQGRALILMASCQREPLRASGCVCRASTRPGFILRNRRMDLEHQEQ